MSLASRMPARARDVELCSPFVGGNAGDIIVAGLGILLPYSAVPPGTFQHLSEVGETEAG
jgi:hypothetical protein